jgi:hypothetical protein
VCGFELLFAANVAVCGSCSYLEYCITLKTIRFILYIELITRHQPFGTIVAARLIEIEYFLQNSTLMLTVCWNDETSHQLKSAH